MSQQLYRGGKGVGGPDTNLIRGYVVSNASLGTFEKREVFLPRRKLNCDSSVVELVAYSL
jgi:hypothetical protein